jgi:hypothetical protein
VLGTSHPREAAFDWFAFRGAIAHAGLAIAAETSLLCNAVRSFAAVKPSGST